MTQVFGQHVFTLLVQGGVPAADAIEIVRCMAQAWSVGGRN